MLFRSKHFAANNKETNRKHSDSRVSERALREIYLKQFEIIVKESDPWTIMSSYNVINGHRASENKELLEELNNRSAGYKKALRWNGLLWAIEDMAEEDYDLDRDAEIRLVFVRSC